MLLYFCFSLVFLQGIRTNLAQYDTKNVIDPNKDTEAIFAGVIKNISRVNNVLQELISNYEHLQKIYKSQENLDSATSDAEIDEVYKSKVKKKRTDTEVTSNKPSDYFPATQIIWSNEENNAEESENVSEDADGEQTGTLVQKPEDGLEINLNEEEQPAQQKNEDSAASDDQVKSEIDDQSDREKQDRSESDGETQEMQRKEPIILSQEFVKPKQAEIIFVDTHESAPSKVHKRIRNKTPKEYQPVTPPKTRYSKVSSSHSSKSKHSSKNKHKDILRSEDQKKKDAISIDSKNLDNISKESVNETKSNASKSSVETNRKVEKKLHSEAFSPHNIWDEIISNKPIQLEAHNEMIFEKVRKDNRGSRSNKALKMRRENPKTALAIVANKNKTKNIQKTLSNNKTIDFTESEDGKDEFEANVLREAYGDACLKLVVRKCYLAVKSAGKAVCDQFRCRGTYKEKFDAFARTACIKEFAGDNKTEAKGAAITRGQAGKLNNLHARVQPEYTASFKDFTREGYMRACLPHIQAMLRETETPQILSRPPNQTKSLVPKNKRFNILRDRYEKACKKISCEKCQIACRSAADNLCESFECNNDRKRAYKIECKKECKRMHRIRKGGSSSDSDSDSSESDSSSTGSGSTSGSSSDSD